MSERIGTFKTCIEAPRFAGFPSFIKDECFMRGLQIEKLDIDKGWILENIRIQIKGKESDLMALNADINRSIEEYNNR